MSWLISLGLVIGIIGTGLFRVPNLPWYQIQRFVYRISPRVRHFQNIKGIFEFVTNVNLKEPTIIFSEDTENDIPFEVPKKTARLLHGVLKSTDFYSPYDGDGKLQSVRIEDGDFSFFFQNDSNYHCSFDRAINRFKIAKDGFLDEYYTGKGVLFLGLGFIVKLAGTLPIL
jgi:hypothetical protein